MEMCKLLKAWAKFFFSKSKDLLIGFFSFQKRGTGNILMDTGDSLAVVALIDLFSFILVNVPLSAEAWKTL